MYYVYLITYINISLKQSVYTHYLLYTEYLHVLHPWSNDGQCQSKWW